MLHSPFSIHLCIPLDTVKPCSVSEWVTRSDPQAVCISFSNKILNFSASIVIQILYILSKNSGQQSTLFESLSRHFCSHCLYVVRDSKELIIIQISTTPRNSMYKTCISSCLFYRFISLWKTK